MVTSVMNDFGDFRISRETLRDIMRVQKFVHDFMQEEGAPRIAIAEEESVAIKDAALRVLAAYAGELDDNGLPKEAVNRVIVETLNKNEDQICSSLTLLAKERVPSSQDYYGIYYQVLNDSGLIRGALEPNILNRLERFRISAPEVYAICGICKACSACPTCSVCLTKMGGAMVTGVTGGTAGTTSTVGALV